MKRYFSVFEMIARSSFYKVLLTIGGMVIAESVCFYLSMISPSGRTIEGYIDQSQYSLIFKIAYILVTILIVLPGMNLGSTQSYTLKRLRIKEKNIFWLQALYNFMAYMLLWGAQLMVIFGSILVYHRNLPEGVVVTNQTYFLAFYRSNFLHSLLPLEDKIGWIILICMAVTSAFATAEFTKEQRIGKFAFELLILIATVMITFPRQLGYEVTFEAIVMAGVYIVIWSRWGLRKLE